MTATDGDARLDLRAATAPRERPRNPVTSNRLRLPPAPATLVRMESYALRCPRCKRTLTGHDPELLADELIAHAEQDHGHAPPREHVVARVERVERVDPAG